MLASNNPKNDDPKAHDRRPPLGYRQVLGRALCCRCPNCGQGKLYQSYLKPVSLCYICGERYDHIRADDGPAWLTILIAGHIIVPLFVILQSGSTTPNWTLMVFCCVLLTALVLGLLPFSKAAFIGVIWRSRFKEHS